MAARAALITKAFHNRYDGSDADFLYVHNLLGTLAQVSNDSAVSFVFGVPTSLKTKSTGDLSSM